MKYDFLSTVYIDLSKAENFTIRRSRRHTDVTDTAFREHSSPYELQVQLHRLHSKETGDNMRYYLLTLFVLTEIALSAAKCSDQI
jgi:hypothetical protein